MRVDGLAVHRSTESDPVDRGYALGRAHRAPIANTVAVYERLFAEDVGLDRAVVMERGERVGERVAAVRPDLVEEIAGIAAGAGQPPALLLAINARTELLAGGALASGGGECSVAGSVGRDCLLAQTWDFHPDLAGSRLLWTIERPDGGSLTTFTEAGIVAKTGINDAGLAVTLNFLAADVDGGEDGLPIHVLLRMLLDGCADRDDAARLLDEATTAASACITVASARGGACDLVSYEVSPRGAQRIEPDARGLLAHTNHFLAGHELHDLALAGTSAESTLGRLDHVRRGLADLHPAVDVAGLRDLLSAPDGAEVFRFADPDQPWLLRCATLATVVYDVGARRMWVRVAADPEAPLAAVELPGTSGGAAA